MSKRGPYTDKQKEWLARYLATSLASGHGDKVHKVNIDEWIKEVNHALDVIEKLPTGAQPTDITATLRDRAASYRLGGPSSEHTAALLDAAADEIEMLRRLGGARSHDCNV